MAGPGGGHGGHPGGYHGYRGSYTRVYTGFGYGYGYGYGFGFGFAPGYYYTSYPGYGIGGTPPFGHPTRLQVLMDRDLLGYDLVWAAGGSPDSVFPITPRNLLSAAEAEVADFKADPS